MKKDIVISQPDEKIINARVDFGLHHDSSPTLILQVQDLPPREAYVYEEHSDTYYAEVDGIAKYFHHDRGNERGFGGEVFKPLMSNGTIREIKGPWSSRAGHVNGRGFGPVVDVMFALDYQSFLNGYTLRTGSVTLNLAQQAVNKSGVPLVRIPSIVECPEDAWYSWITALKPEVELCLPHFLDIGPYWVPGGKLRLSVHLGAERSWAYARTSLNGFTIGSLEIQR